MASSEWLLYTLIAVIVLCLLGLIFHKGDDSRASRVRFVECWYYDALGCPIYCGIFPTWDDESSSALDKKVGERIGRNTKYYGTVMERENG